MDGKLDLEARVRRLEDRNEICELIARYGLVMDDRDIDGMPGLFTPDVTVRSVDGEMNARGLDAVVAQFKGRFEVLGPSHHFSHDKIIQFDAEDLAHGTVLSHAEMNRKGQPMLAAIRYSDVYRRHQAAGNFPSACWRSSTTCPRRSTWTRWAPAWPHACAPTMNPGPLTFRRA